MLSALSLFSLARLPGFIARAIEHAASVFAGRMWPRGYSKGTSQDQSSDALVTLKKLSTRIHQHQTIK
jgi:hypothetical protein